ncbi:MAG: hypothetical protein HKN20_18390, partial [Gemmatimonadetes bacterium]|nr:hypothetical protein [Gemmatimonadota bacterium]
MKQTSASIRSPKPNERPIVMPLMTAIAILIVSLVMTGAGCSDRERPAPLFETMTDRDADFDFGVLRDKKILLDPGHGGRYRGTQGREGLEECTVNLAVG